MSDTGTIRPQLMGRKFHEGWIEQKDSQRNGWNKYWLVLKQCKKLILFIFRDEDTSPESQVGLLTFDSNTEFKVRDGDAKNGYKFDLYTTNRRNTFKGTLPADLDLIKDHIQKIQSDIDYHKKGSPISIADSGLGMDLTSISSRSSGSGGNSSMAGRSTMRHRFYRDPRYSGVPSWFILGCSRDFAEKILMEAKKLGMGNTLLREGTTHMSTGSYAISKRVDYPAGCAFEHYEVAQVAEGYKLNVQNDHQPMMCLSDIMDFFIQTSGPTTKLLTNNNLQAFMLDTPNYQSMIHRRTPAVEKSSWSSSPVKTPAGELVIKRFEEPACDYYNVPDCCRGEQVIEGFEEPACEYYNDPDLFTQVGRASYGGDGNCEYDDTAIITNVSAKLGGSPAQSSQYKDPKRRASEPVIPMAAKLGSDYVNVKKETEKVDPAFLSNLNQMMLTPQSEKFRTRIHHQSS